MTGPSVGSEKRCARRLGVAAALVVAVLTAALAGAETLAVDPTASRVRVHLGRAGLLRFLGHDHEIDAPIAEGRVEVTENNPTRSSVRLRFEAGRLAVVPGSEPAGDIPKVEERMRGPEVLDVARHTQIVFTSSAVTGEAVGSGRHRLRVEGTLELKGRSFPIAVPLEVQRTGSALEAHGEVELRLRDLGVEPPSVARVVNVANRFRLAFEITARPVATPPPDASSP